MNQQIISTKTARSYHILGMRCLGAIRLAAIWRFSLLTIILSSSYLFATTKKVIAKKMGSRFEITAVHPKAAVAEQAIKAAYIEIDRLEAMISSWNPNSATSEINRMAGQQPVSVPQDLFNLIRRAKKVANLTDGAFDISYDGFGQLWDFKNQHAQKPTRMMIQTALEKVGSQYIELNAGNQTVFLQKPGMRIGFGAIGKGFAANRAVWVLKEQGITGGVVNAGGDMVLFGRQENGQVWEVGIAHPRKPEKVYATLRLTEQAVVTSGDYESFITIDAKRYAHILNPKTGYPVDFLQSVTVICPDGELADALATAIFVMGPLKGLQLINQLENVACLVIDADGKQWATPNIHLYAVNLRARNHHD